MGSTEANDRSIQPVLDLVGFYTEASGFSADKLDPETLEYTLRNGESVDVAFDALSLVGMHIDAPTTHFNKKGERLTAFALGMVIGSALERDGTLPDEYSALAEKVRSRIPDVAVRQQEKP